MMIQGIVGTQSALGQKPRSSQQNNLLGNRSGNSERPERQGLRRVINRRAC